MRAIRPTVGLILCLAASGCYTWEMTSLEAQRRSARPEKLRVELTNGEEIVLENGLVTADSVVSAGMAGIPKDRVLLLSARRFDVTMSGFLALAVLVPTVAIIGVTTTNTCGAGAAPSC